jgi:DNA-binding transcriptional regulator YiaG
MQVKILNMQRQNTVIFDVGSIRKGGQGMDNKKIGDFIAARRRSKNLTQKELAERLGVTDKAVSKWERGGSHS